MLELFKGDLVFGLVDLFDHVPEDFNLFLLRPQILN